jgi:hypothetical protein
LVTAEKASTREVDTINVGFNMATNGTNMSAGDYKLYAVDAAGNVSEPSVGTITLSIT